MELAYTTRHWLTKRAEHVLKLNENTDQYGLKPGGDVGTGKLYDPKKKRLSEIIDAMNDLFGAEISDDDQLHFANGVAARISRDEEVMAQVKGHSPDQVMHGVFPKRIEDIVLGATIDHEKMAHSPWQRKGHRIAQGSFHSLLGATPNFFLNSRENSLELENPDDIAISVIDSF